MPRPWANVMIIFSGYRLSIALAHLSLIGMAAMSQAGAQLPGRPDYVPSNLQVLPKGMPISVLIDTMGRFTRALGVRCSYCHVGPPGAAMADLDFASDDKPEKRKAREMLRMVAAINGDHLARLASRRDPPIVVTCATCHRGVTEPRPLQQVLLAAYDGEGGGVDSIEATYRALRDRYYGRSAYDFGEVALVDVADVLRRRGRTADAVRVYLFNTLMVPTSLFALRSAAAGQLVAGDTAGAMTSLERALAINPNDQLSRTQLDRLKAKSPR
jgi:hypothetical protein